jgi:hypothetical protein
VEAEPEPRDAEQIVLGYLSHSLPSISSAASDISSLSISDDAAAVFLRFHSSPLDGLTAELSRLSSSNAGNSLSRWTGSWRAIEKMSSIENRMMTFILIAARPKLGDREPEQSSTVLCKRAHPSHDVYSLDLC